MSLSRKGCLASIAVALVLGLVFCAWLFYEIRSSVYRLGGQPRNIAIAPNGLAFVTDWGQPSTMLTAPGGALWVADTQSDQQVDVLRVYNPGNPVATQNGFVYLLAGNPFIEVVDSSRPTKASRIEIPIPRKYEYSTSGLRGLLELPNGRLLVPNVNGLQLIDPQTKDIKTVSPLTYASSLLYISNPSKIYAASRGITIVDSDSYTKTGQVQGLPNAEFDHLRLVSPPVAVAAYITRTQNGVVFIDTGENRSISQVELGNVPVVGMVQVSTEKLYVLQGKADEWDYHTATITAMVPYSFPNLTGTPVFANPSIVAYGVYYVTIVAIPTHRVVGKIELHREPFIYTKDLDSIALAPNGKVYVVYGHSWLWSDPNRFEQVGFGLYVIDPEQDVVVGRIPFSVPWEKYVFLQ